jgi:plasmid maintenance system antidote protein VapI
MTAMTSTVQGDAPGPGKLLDKLLDMLDLKNDAALARVLEVAPGVISKIRHARLEVGATIRLRILDLGGGRLTLNGIRELLGEPPK